MSTTPDNKPPKTPANKGQAGAGSHPPPIKQLLTRDGAPWRPFVDDGVLIHPSEGVRVATALFSDCEKLLLTHLKAVCLWPEGQREQTWRPGDYAFYILSFDPAPGTHVYLQCWSEPLTNDLLVEVSSGAWNPPADKYVDSATQEMLRDHGFEIGGKADNFRKAVKIETAKDVRAFAREAVAILCKVLRYDGTQALKYSLHLGTPWRICHALDSISASELVVYLRDWGYSPSYTPSPGDQVPVIRCRVQDGPFDIALVRPCDRPANRYRTLALSAYSQLTNTSAGDRHLRDLTVVNNLNTRIPAVQFSVNETGRLAIDSAIFLDGGVTAEHLRALFDAWCSGMRAVADVMS